MRYIVMVASRPVYELLANYYVDPIKTVRVEDSTPSVKRGLLWTYDSSWEAEMAFAAIRRCTVYHAKPAKLEWSCGELIRGSVPK